MRSLSCAAQAAVIFSVLIPQGIRADAEARPNVVVFIVDDLGYGDLGCFGRQNISTPHIDEIAANGVKFTQWISAAPICTPSRAAFQTGRLPMRFGMVANSLPFRVFPTTASTDGIPETEKTIGQALQMEGYRTIMSGKWHLGISSLTENYAFLPRKKGYDSWVGVPYTNMHKCKEIPQDGEGKYWCMLMHNETIVQQPLVEQNLTQALTSHAISQMELAVETRTPFFMLYNFVHVHTPLFTSPLFKGKSRGGEFGDNVEEMDDAVGKVLKALDRLAISESTLVVLTSDNGPYAEEGYDYAGRTGGLKGSKAQNWEGGIRMPAVARWPGVIPPGQVSDTLVNTMDLWPTIVGLAGGHVNETRLDGRDILEVLRDPARATSPHQYMFHYCGFNLAAVRQVLKERVIKYHLLPSKWTNTKTDLCNECCPNSFFAKFGGTLCDCVKGKDLENREHDPLVFDMTHDPTESVPLNASNFPGGSQAFETALQNMRDAVRKHMHEVGKVPHSRLKSMSPFNFPCCNGRALLGASCECSFTSSLVPRTSLALRTFKESLQ
mmetsp:Transcript_18280/g.33803  ORF Transcript_18280/g.33803 Transcript_18280/m.33803 type:complete len:552 (+) Transcript_18280:64-1719(+)